MRTIIDMTKFSILIGKMVQSNKILTVQNTNIELMNIIRAIENKYWGHFIANFNIDIWNKEERIWKNLTIANTLWHWMTVNCLIAQYLYDHQTVTTWLQHGYNMAMATTLLQHSYNMAIITTLLQHGYNMAMAATLLQHSYNMAMTTTFYNIATT